MSQVNVGLSRPPTGFVASSNTDMITSTWRTCASLELSLQTLISEIRTLSRKIDILSGEWRPVSQGELEDMEWER